MGYKFISKIYSLLDTIYFRHNSPRDSLPSFIKNEENKILEISIGTGDNAIILGKKCTHSNIIGVDISKEMLDICIKRIKTEKINNVSAILMDGTSLTFSNNSFDYVILSLILHEVPEKTLTKLLEESKRVLKPSGRILIVEWEKPNSLLKKPLFKIIELIEPKGFDKFLNADKEALFSHYNLKTLSKKSCNYTAIYELSK